MRSDHELVILARAGNREGIAALFDRYASNLWRVAYAITGCRELAEDVLQDAFIQALGALDRFDDDRPLLPWLRRIAVNRALNLTRRARHEVLGDASFADAVNRTPGRQAEAWLADAVRALLPDRRVAVVLRYWLDFTPAEIAEALDVPVGTINSRLARSLAELRVKAEDGRVCEA